MPKRSDLAVAALLAVSGCSSVASAEQTPSALHVCVDRSRVNPLEMAEGARQRERVGPALRMMGLGDFADLAGPISDQWDSRLTLTVAFLAFDETNSPQRACPEFVRQRVMKYANEWTKYQRIGFVIGSSNGTIQVACTPGVGSWSLVGREHERAPRGQPTMNFGWLTIDTGESEFKRVILHEFGHALGFIHEHQSPEFGIPWKRESVYAWYKKTQNWDAPMVDAQVFKRYAGDMTWHSTLDLKSIMMYPIPADFTTDGSSVVMNWSLSPIDQREAARRYPKL